MLMRPLAPYNARPVKKVTLRRAPAAELIETTAAEAVPSIKAVRRPVKFQKLRVRAPLKVAERGLD